MLELPSQCPLCFPGIYNGVYATRNIFLPFAVSNPMTQRSFRIPATFVLGTALFATAALAQTHPAAPESPYGGVTVEDIVARVNDQIITQSDYDRAMKEMDDGERERGASMQDISAGHKDLLRNLIDQQLWLSKGKELNITGETELVNQLNAIRKQYNLDTMEDLEKAAKEQGVSFEDFKANIRNRIITQQVMREEVGSKVNVTPGEVQRYYEAHKQEYVRPESVQLSEILVALPAPTLQATMPGSTPQDDPVALAAAKTKADDIEAKLHSGGDFSQLARSFSDSPTASEGGNMGQYTRGQLAKVFEDATFTLKTGDITDPIRTKQGFVILKVVQHVTGGVPELKDVQDQVEDAFYTSLMEPRVRDYLTTLREQAAIFVKDGFADTGRSPNQTEFVFSSYTPPAPKKRKKVERTRFRESTHTFRQKSGAAPAATVASAAPTTATKKDASLTTQKPGKKEKIRFGQAPTKTLPNAATAKTEDASAAPEQQASTNEPANPLEATNKPTQKTRFSARPKQAKTPKGAAALKVDGQAPAPPDAAEVADRQTQDAPLGVNGDTSVKKKKTKPTSTGDKTRLTDKSKTPQPPKPTPQMTPTPEIPGAPAPIDAPAPAPQPAPAPAP
jgi:peptidyl-prolyl cis-trans isomerase SurA